MTGRGWGYVATFLGASALSLVLTPQAVRVALRRGILDRPGGHKSHSSPVPYLGGLAIVLSFAIAVLVGSAIDPPHSGLDDLAVILAVAVALSVMGLIDDLRGLGALVRLVAEVGAGVALWAVGVRVDLFGLSALNLAITVVWVVGVTNAFNLLDNMDGLSSGVATIAALAFFAIAASNGQFLVASLAIALAGCSLGFLRHNFHPATIYMGDAGSLFLGFILAALGVRLRFDGPVQTTFLVPPMVLAVPIVDTTLVTFSRLHRRISPFQGGKDHVSHRLVRLGMPVPVAVVLIYAAAVHAAGLAAVLSRVDRGTGVLLVVVTAATGGVVALLLARVPVDRPDRSARRPPTAPS